MTERVLAWIGLGANLGEPERALIAALAALAALPGTRLAAASSPWRSAPVDAQGPDFLNAVAGLDTSLAPEALLDALLAIEHEAGRERPYRNAPRVLDLDLLLYGDARLESPRLSVPHPRMHERAFVLAPLLELAPAIAVPGRGAASELLSRTTEQRLVRQAPPPGWPTLPQRPAESPP
jgi:2-amino-4-hydroxy-6-hydroxymethyldihydropteridine diphosphokinase